MTEIFVTALVTTFTLLCVHFWPHSSEESQKWALYYSTLASLFISYFFLIEKRIHTFHLRKQSSQLSTIGLCLLILPCLILQAGPVDSLSLFCGLIFGLGYLIYLNKVFKTELDRVSQTLILIVSTGAWKLAFRLIEWWAPHHIREVFQDRSAIFVGTLLLSLFLVSRFRKERGQHLPQLGKIATAFAFALIAFMLGRPYILWGTLLHHHSFYVGPIELIKQGASLLWDVPSQYGLLNIYLASKIHIGNTWQSFMILNKIFVASYAVILFLFVKEYLNSPRGIILAGLVTTSAMFCWVGYFENLMGPFILPSVGAFRFVWSLAQLFLCLLISKSKEGDRYWKLKNNLGYIIWATALFWSIECAIYSTAIWFTFKLVNIYLESDSSISKRFVTATAKLVAILIIIPFAIFSVVTIIFKLQEGHWPDWYNYIEYAQVYRAGFGALAMNPGGSVWILVCLFILGTATGFLALKQSSKLAPFMFAGLAMIWTVATYFVSRSHENNLSTLMPLILAFVTSTLIVLRDLETEPVVKPLFFAICFPLLFVVLEASFSHRRFKEIFPTVQTIDYLGATLQPELPPIESDYVEKVKELAYAKTRVNISSEDPSVLAFIYLEVLPTSKKHPDYWLPLAPEFELEILKPERQLVYIQRFVERKKESGWLIRRVEEPSQYPVLYQALEKNFKRDDFRKFGSYNMEHFSYHP